MARRFSYLIALLLVVVACTDSGASTTTSGAVNGSTSTTIAGQTTTTESGSPSTTVNSSAPTTEPDLSGLEGVSDEVRSQLEDLIRQAQEIRGLPFLTPPKITVVTENELEDRVRAELMENAEDVPSDEALYKMLGLLAERADLGQTLNDLYGEQVAGFYDGSTGEIVVPARQDGFSILQQGTLIHELVHALTDQHFKFYAEFEAMVDQDRLDQATAYQALIEGDASLAEVLWIQTLSQEDIGKFLAESLDIDSSALNAAPRFLRESLLFPYDTGLAFTQSLYLSVGGWDELNDAYTTFPGVPASTEQVIDPSGYQTDLPVDVPIPEVNVPGYELTRTSVWGEEGFRILLDQGAAAASMPEAANGWGGDSYHQWFDGTSAAMLIVYQGDTQTDVNELEQSLLTFANEDFPEEHFAWVDQVDGNLYFIAADVPEVGEQIRASVGLD